jgi:hypothetical protein
MRKRLPVTTGDKNAGEKYKPAGGFGLGEPLKRRDDPLDQREIGFGSDHAGGWCTALFSSIAVLYIDLGSLRCLRRKAAAELVGQFGQDQLGGRGPRREWTGLRTDLPQALGQAHLLFRRIVL